MADGSREDSLAAARKRLKRFQVKNTRTSESNSIEHKVQKKKSDVSISESDTSIKPQINASEKQTTDVQSHNQIQAVQQELSPFVTPLEERTSSSSEKIRQISSQLNGLMSQTHEFLNGEIETGETGSTELEKRNVELASLSEKQAQLNEQLAIQIQDLKKQNGNLEQKLQNQEAESAERHLKEQRCLKEQLEVHIQTIGILVAEKTELQASLSQSHQTAKQKAFEVEELQGRLKACRQRLTDMERDTNNMTTTNQQLENNLKEVSKEVDRLKMDFYKSNRQVEELKQQNSEQSEKLNEKFNECHSLRESLDETQSKLAMAELHVQQLARTGGSENKLILEELNEEKIQQEKKISQLKDSVRTLTHERDSLADQYQHLTNQLNEQVQSLSEQVTKLNEEKASLANDKLELNSMIHTLEEKSSKQPQTIDNSEARKLQELVDTLTNEKIKLHDEHKKQLSDNAELSQIVHELEARTQSLESELSEVQQDKEDRKLLLEEIQSDKVAASRAISQNRELKNQLEELQNGFIQISNNKLDLAEKLESEQSISKELSERLLQQEDELNLLRKEVSSKDHQLDLSRQSSTELTKQMYQQQQLVDRVRHYEAQGQLSDILQNELDQAKDRVGSLTIQNQELRTLLAQQAQQLLQSNANGSNDKQDSSKNDDMIASLSASVHQLEMERDQLLRQLGEQQGQREVFRAQLKEMKENKNPVNGDTVPPEKYENLKHVLYQLENRFTKTMKDIAELSDQKQQLEHLVTQLQGETDTIGEYIALYQVQRGIMKQRALEKDEYIAQLARDREDMKIKLTELQNLIMRLLYERQQYQMNGLNGVEEHIKFPGKVVSTAGSSGDMSALNGMAVLPEWPDILDDFVDSMPDKDAKMSLREKDGGAVKNDNEATAKKIIDLISEIGSSSLIEKPVLDNFHPCPLCSGKLMTV